MAEREFNLCEEPWICALGKDYKTVKLSIPDVLIHSDQYMDLAGESESQNVAILRMLLAFLHTVFYRYDETGKESAIDSEQEAMRRWKAIWNLGHIPERPIRNYISKWHDRFWLFDDEHPFYQSPISNDGKKKFLGYFSNDYTYYSASKLNGILMESREKAKLSSPMNGKNKNALSFDEAARWVIHLQAFDDCAAKPVPPVCWPLGFALVYAKGNTFFETLMLNFVILNPAMPQRENALWVPPKPSWETEIIVPKSREEKEDRYILPPTNQAELLSFQGALCHLERSNGAVTGYIEIGGFRLKKENIFIEQMTLWEKPQKGNYCPVTTAKMTPQLWRYFPSLLVDDDSVNAREPGIVSWAKVLYLNGYIPETRMITFFAVGMRPGSKNCGINYEYADTLQFNAGILEELGDKWVAHISEEVAVCKKLADDAGKLAVDLLKARGTGNKSKSKTGNDDPLKKIQTAAIEQAYTLLDEPFRRWLLNLKPGQSLKERKELRQKWRDVALTIIMDFGYDLVRKAGDHAVIGRMRVENEKEKYCCSPDALLQFKKNIAKYNYKDK